MQLKWAVALKWTLQLNVNTVFPFISTEWCYLLALCKTNSICQIYALIKPNWQPISFATHTRPACSLTHQTSVQVYMILFMQGDSSLTLTVLHVTRTHKRHDIARAAQMKCFLIIILWLSDLFCRCLFFTCSVWCWFFLAMYFFTLRFVVSAWFPFLVFHSVYPVWLRIGVSGLKNAYFHSEFSVAVQEPWYNLPMVIQSGVWFPLLFHQHLDFNAQMFFWTELKSKSL